MAYQYESYALNRDAYGYESPLLSSKVRTRRQGNGDTNFRFLLGYPIPSLFFVLRVPIGVAVAFTKPVYQANEDEKATVQVQIASGQSDIPVTVR